MAEQLENELVGHLLALLAHDLRNPLSALHSNVGYLVGLPQCEDTDTREALEDAGLSCECLVVIIDNLDVLARHLERKVDAAKARFPALSAVNETISRCERIAASHNCQLSLVEEPTAGAIHVRANRDFLVRSLMNLTLNSVQHASNSTVELSLKRAGNECRIAIVDKGPILSEEDRKVAFSAEGQVLAKTNGSGRYSRGLGLLVASLSANIAGAKLDASPEGPLNCFAVTLPCAD